MFKYSVSATVWMLCLIVNSSASIAQPNKLKPISLSIRVNLEDVENDTIEVMFRKEVINSLINGQKLYAVADSNGYCKFPTFYSDQPVEMFYLLVHNPVGSKRKFKVRISNRILMPGDSIEIKIRDSMDGLPIVEYTGAGSDKFRVFERMRLASHRYKKSLNEVDTIQTDIVKKIMDRFVEKGGELDVVMDTLTASRGMLDPFVYDYYMADAVGGIGLERCDLLSAAYKSIKEEDNVKIQSISDSLLNMSLLEISSGALAMSEAYISFLLRRTSLKMRFERRRRYFAIGEMYKQLKQDYSGLERELVLTHFLMGGHVGKPGEAGQDMEYCLSDALKIIKRETFREALAKRLQFYRRGSDAFNFSLPDVNGRLVKLSDFKGKVVLVDVWFTGCGACAELAKAFEEKVLPKFKNNQNVAFVSVSIDKEESKWLNSVKKGIYTNENSINLYTGGKGIDHEFTRMYDITGCPKVFLIGKDGKMFSATPPRAEIYSEELISLIYSAINE